MFFKLQITYYIVSISFLSEKNNTFFHLFITNPIPDFLTFYMLGKHLVLLLNFIGSAFCDCSESLFD